MKQRDFFSLHCNNLCTEGPLSCRVYLQLDSIVW